MVEKDGMEDIEIEYISHKELLGSPIKSNNLVQSLINQGTYILGIDTYPEDDVVPLEVKRVKECLKVIIKRTMKIKKK